MSPLLYNDNVDSNDSISSNASESSVLVSNGEAQYEWVHPRVGKERLASRRRSDTYPGATGPSEDEVSMRVKEYGGRLARSGIRVVSTRRRASISLADGDLPDSRRLQLFWESFLRDNKSDSDSDSECSDTSNTSSSPPSSPIEEDDNNNNPEVAIYDQETGEPDIPACYSDPFYDLNETNGKEMRRSPLVPHAGKAAVLLQTKYRMTFHRRSQRSAYNIIQQRQKEKAQLQAERERSNDDAAIVGRHRRAVILAYQGY